MGHVVEEGQHSGFILLLLTEGCVNQLLKHGADSEDCLGGGVHVHHLVQGQVVKGHPIASVPVVVFVCLLNPNKKTGVL